MLPPTQRYLASLLLLGLCFMGSACGNGEELASNAPPTLTGPNALVTQAAPGDAIALTVEATDADGDTLTYAWFQTPASPAGTFSSTTAAHPTWAAPEVTTAQRFTLFVTVTDGKGGSTQGMVAVDVMPPVPGNTAPTLAQRPSATPSTVTRNQPTTLSVTATDSDSDTLTYSWEQVSPASPVGTFSDASSPTPEWTAPDSGTFTLRVTISDSRGGSVQDTVDVEVQTDNRPPTVAESITAPGTLLAGATGTFSITASDPDGDPLSYSWEQQAPTTQGTWVGPHNTGSAQWYSPVVGTRTSFTLKVSVTDGRSAPVVRSVTVPVVVPRYTDDIQPVWSSAGCTGCHSTSGGLNLSAGSSYRSLVGVTASIRACNTLSRVQAGEPDNSVLVRKLEGTACGARMPRNNPAYFDRNPGLLVRIRSWILAGAHND